MPKPTTRDLATAAGVSLATVDRVLNHREGVRLQTVERVNEAVRRIGFVRDVAAANLARRKEYTFVFLLPARTDEFIATLAQAVTEIVATARRDRLDVRLLRVSMDDPHVAVRAMTALIKEGIDGIAVMAPETAQMRDAIRRARARGIAVVAFVSDQPSAERERFVGINDLAAGRTAATLIGRFARREAGQVVVLAETIQSRDSLDRRRGFDEVLLAEYPWLTAQPTVETWADAGRTDRVLAQALRRKSDTRAIYLMGSAAAMALKTLERHVLSPDCTIIAHELTYATRAALEDGRIGAVIHQDVGHLVRSALRVLRAKAEGSTTIPSQERIRIEIVLQTNLPAEEACEAAE